MSIAPLSGLAPLTSSGFDTSAANYGVTYFDPSSIIRDIAPSSASPGGNFNIGDAGNLLLDALNPAAALGSAGGKATAQAGGSLWTNLFLRGTIIILGFIFIAVGLSMFKGTAANVIQKVTK